jgi:succinate dehydrogenase/fumarate reductase-like Fe-S protein
MGTYQFKIQRFNPDKDKRPHYEEYSVDLELSAELRARRVWLRRDADQWPESARL